MWCNTMMRRMLAKLIEDSQMVTIDPLMNQLEQAMEAGHGADVRTLSREITELLWANV